MKFTVEWKKAKKGVGISVSDINGKPASEDLKEFEAIVLTILKAEMLSYNFELADIISRKDFNELKARYKYAEKLIEEAEKEHTA